MLYQSYEAPHHATGQKKILLNLESKLSISIMGPEPCTISSYSYDFSFIIVVNMMMVMVMLVASAPAALAFLSGNN